MYKALFLVLFFFSIITNNAFAIDTVLFKTEAGFTEADNETANNQPAAADGGSIMSVNFDRVDIFLNCDVINATISRFYLYARNQTNTSLYQIKFDGSLVYLGTRTADTSLGWEQFTLDNPFDCISGTKTLQIITNGAIDWQLRGNRLISTSTLNWMSHPSAYLYTATGTTQTQLDFSRPAIALVGSAYEPPETPIPARPITLPESLETGLIIRTATTTCNTTPTTSECITEYTPEFYYLDWLLINIFIIFLLSFPAIGFFLNKTIKK